MKVYVIIKEYFDNDDRSHYEIESIWSSKEKAEQEIIKLKKSIYIHSYLDIEEWELDKEEK